MEVEIRTLEPQPTIVIRARVRVEEISAFVPAALQRVYTTAEAHGWAPAGMPFVRYLDMGAGHMDLEAGTALASPAPGEGDIVPSELPGGTCAVTWHVGPFDTIGTTYNALVAWVAQNGHEQAGAPWECYWSDPEVEPDPSTWRTEIFMPVR